MPQTAGFTGQCRFMEWSVHLFQRRENASLLPGLQLLIPTDSAGFEDESIVRLKL